MRVFYIQKLLKFLNANFKHESFGENTIWYFKDKIVALWDDGNLEVLWDIFKEGVLRPW